MVKLLSRRVACFGLPLLALAMTIASPAGAQTYPSSTIRIVVAAAAGTPPDIISRIIATELGRSDGWRMIAENKPGRWRDRMSVKHSRS